MAISAVTVQKCVNERGLSQLYVQLASLLRIATQPPSLGGVFLDASWNCMSENGQTHEPGCAIMDAPQRLRGAPCRHFSWLVSRSNHSPAIFPFPIASWAISACGDVSRRSSPAIPAA